MRTSLGSLNDPLHGGITVLIFAVATLIKFLPATLMTKCVTHRSWRFSTSVGILMNTRGNKITCAFYFSIFNYLNKCRPLKLGALTIELII
ncbi:unnamed protein product [Rotaria magnacalcarata]